MDIKALAQGRYILWGASWSLYSAKVRPYLRKKGLDYVEINPSHPHFSEKIVPAIGYLTVPVLELPSGDFIADSTEIIEYLEGQHPANPMIPADKTMAALAWLIHSYGSEGLHKPAMHYRWNTTQENRQFIINDFERSFELREKRKTAEKTLGSEFADSMKAYVPALGITPTTVEAVERSTRKLYHLLNAHFLNFPYVLGGHPSIADFGLMGPIYAHLGRDVSSANELKINAPALYRWIETMNNPNIVDPELWSVPPAFFDRQQLPQSLIELLKLLCADYGPELIATANAYHHWLGEKRDRPSGTVIAIEGQKATHQVIGEIEHLQQGVSIKRIAMLDCLIQHQRLSAIQQRMDDGERQAFEQLLESVGGSAIAELELERLMMRENYAYVIA
ncbi:MAG: glutathione S-transferase family protein [Halieaceae bacterium]|nr:glutathione S-transferase family protein [Halieaceae bacterium]